MMELTQIQRKQLLETPHTSFTELKHRIEELMQINADPAIIMRRRPRQSEYETGDPLLIKASQLGRQALRDPAIMGALWSKFKTQNKIATFLNVNRSSVNRRCKQYDLLD